MWILESNDALDGRCLWLRPGKTYLFGRTASEPGQFAIRHNTISRRHLTITVDSVRPGDAYNPATRSRLTIEDLKTKSGTVVNGQQINGDKYVVKEDSVEFVMGKKCPSKFYIKWNPVVLTFSFTSKEIQTSPFQDLQQRFEHLDIKLLTDYNVKYSTHVVSKKRNTAKGLQALINGKFIVTETFINAIVEASQLPKDEGESSLLEQDFEKHWPDAISHLPPPGGEPKHHPETMYAPDRGREGVFEGYTFIFYDSVQYNNLLAPVTNGGGKALLKQVAVNTTEVDDFVRDVKTEAGEKGLGSFEDGSEGKGVVLVRFVPAKGEQIQWYTDFFTAVSLRLDHRPIEQSEFLEAILIKDASILRRPLEFSSASNTQEVSMEPTSRTRAADQPPSREGVESQDVGETQATSRRGRSRRTVKKRFAGFDDSSDVDMDETSTTAPPENLRHARDSPLPDNEEGGLFVSQEAETFKQGATQETGGSIRSRGKRSPPPEYKDDLMADIAPAAARFKKQRIERGDVFKSPTSEPGPEPEPEPEVVQQKPQKKAKKELDVLAVVAQNRQEVEARALAEKEALATLHNGVDLAEIRRLQIVEEMPLRRRPAETLTSRERDIADGRWNPRWNGMRDFKKFRRQGQEAQGRPPAKTIVTLTEVRNKEFGVGDDYWLEDENSSSRNRAHAQPSAATDTRSLPDPAPTLSKKTSRFAVDNSYNNDDDELDELESVGDMGTSTTLGRDSGASTSQTRSQTTGRTRTATTETQQSSTTQSQGKRRAASPPPAAATTAKRARPMRKVVQVADSDDSDDELKFRFGKRR